MSELVLFLMVECNYRMHDNSSYLVILSEPETGFNVTLNKLTLSKAMLYMVLRDGEYHITEAGKQLTNSLID